MLKKTTASNYHHWRFIAYHSLWRITLFLARTFKAWLPFKLQRYLEEREFAQLVWRTPPQENQRRIWFHAASGEIEYIKPILRQWKTEHPNDLLFLTYFSTSARSMLKSIPELDGWAPLPFDLPEPCQRFFGALKPHLLVISRTDLWPTILDSAASIPIVLVASTWAEGSKKTRGLGRCLTRWCLNYIDKVCVVSEADAAWVRDFAPTSHIAVTGDPRFDQVAFRLQQKRPLPPELTRWTEQHSILVAGSTWEEDEQVLVTAWKNALQQWNEKSFPGAQVPRLLIVPHETHADHLRQLTALLTSNGLNFSLWSQIKTQSHPIETSIVIFDEKGWLAELYQLGHWALIGGSFKKQVHSVMEALGCGLPVLVGPHYKNNREAIEFTDLRYDETFFVTSVPDSESLTQALTKLWQLPGESAITLRNRINQEFINRCRATEKTIKEIQQCL